MTPPISIFWFRQDLRLSDNPALVKAAASGSVLPIYILDDEVRREQAASDWWLHHSLQSLNKSLENKLHLYRGNPLDILCDLVEKTGAKNIYWSRLYTPDDITRDTKIKSFFKDKGIGVYSENASLLWEPWEIIKDDDTPYKVFTPFYKKCRASPLQPRTPLPAPNLTLTTSPDSLPVTDLNLLPKIAWDKKLEKYWQIGEQAAQQKCHDFASNKLAAYKNERDYPAIKATSTLSPHLHFGEISPHQVWHQVLKAQPSQGRDHFLSELGWREFGYMLIYHFPETREKSLNAKFDHFPWVKNDTLLAAWQQGQTGIPIIDAGMRELWESGIMHNRVRMITASLLVKNLMIHWREGEQWFFDCLVDADLPNNVAGWQWVAGSGADAAPYFRIFNPVTQSKKFDPEGDYIRRFVPELSNLSAKHIHAPWEVAEQELSNADVILGSTYPHPICDLKTSRVKALEAYKQL